jgi:hypothetical protein
MTLDQLIEQLQELRRQYPAAGNAIVFGSDGVLESDEIEYEHGDVSVGKSADDD